MASISAGPGLLESGFGPSADPRSACAVSPDGKVVFTRTRDNESTAHTIANDLDTGRELWRKKHPQMGWLPVSPDGSRLVTWGAGSQLTMDILDAVTGKTVGAFAHPDENGHPAHTSGGVAVGPKAERLFVAHSWTLGELSVFELGSEKPVSRVAVPWCDNALLTPDGKTAVVGRGRTGTTLEVWDAVEKKIKSSVACRVGSTFALSPDGGTIAVLPENSDGLDAPRILG